LRVPTLTVKNIGDKFGLIGTSQTLLILLITMKLLTRLETST